MKKAPACGEGVVGLTRVVSALGFDYIPHLTEGLVVDVARSAKCIRGVYPTAIVEVQYECSVLDQVVVGVPLDYHLVRAVSLLAAARCDEDVFAFGCESNVNPYLCGAVFMSPALKAGEEESGWLDGHGWE